MKVRKLQLSLELLIYIALASVSAAFALAALRNTTSFSGNFISSYKISQFVDTINGYMLNGSYATIRIFVPAGLCNATVHGNVLSTRLGDFYFSEPVVIAQKLCPDNSFEQLSVYSDNGSAAIGT